MIKKDKNLIKNIVQFLILCKNGLINYWPKRDISVDLKIYVINKVVVIIKEKFVDAMNQKYMGENTVINHQVKLQN